MRRPALPCRADSCRCRAEQAGAGRAVLPDDTRGLVLARRRLTASRPLAVGHVRVADRSDGWPEGGLRLRLVGERPDRHSLHDGAGHPAEGAGLVRLRRRERPRPLPRATERPDRGWPELVGRPARPGRRPRRLPPVGALRRLSAERRHVVDRRLGRDLEPELERDAHARLDVGGRGRPADPPGPRPLRRGRLGRDRPRDPLHRAEDAERLRLAGEPQGRLGDARRTRRWARGSG